SMTSVTSLKHQIKTWEHQFQKQHNRLPSKQDVKLDPKIYKLYKTYRTVKTQNQVPVKAKELEININVNDVQSDQEPEAEDETPEYQNVQGELGPTPQANGKVLSIFDFRFTPPDSSPLKQKETSTGNELFKTPTKLKPVSPFNNNPLDTPVKSQASPIQTPRLVKINSSPFNNSPTKTPVRSTTLDFLVSPSPLKSHRFLSKKLSDVFNDFKSIQEEDNHYLEEEIEEEIEEEESTNDPAVPRKKKKFTQKRTTRRWKIKPRLAEVGEDELKGKNIHKEIEKINKEDHDQLVAFIDSDNAESDSSDDNDEYVSKEPKNTKGMIKPISMNYQRLKINDPRAKAFKRRMGR
ncbi:uncharacterized protein CANTADRAFT_28519, partial [Suhomyces tanzawaensis NRRL Y-17324]